MIIETPTRERGELDHLLEEGRTEGREEGRKEGRRERRKG